MGDQHKLRLYRKLLEDVAKAPHIGLIERGIDLVHDAERTGPGLEQREEKRGGNEGALTAGEQRKLLAALARELRNDLNAGLGQMARIGEHELRFAAAEEPAEIDPKLGRHGLEGTAEARAQAGLELSRRCLDGRGGGFEIG